MENNNLSYESTQTKIKMQETQKMLDTIESKLKDFSIKHQSTSKIYNSDSKNTNQNTSKDIINESSQLTTTREISQNLNQNKQYHLKAFFNKYQLP